MLIKRFVVIEAGLTGHEGQENFEFAISKKRLQDQMQLLKLFKINVNINYRETSNKQCIYNY